jgi:type IV pilus assembly protein PilN
MPRINLLPWRAEQRKKRRNQFFIALGGAVLAAGLVVLLGSLVMGAIIDNQRERNQVLEDEIAALDKRIEEILDLEAKKEGLLARMEIIEKLQRSRPEVVHVFDQLVRTLPDGVSLNSVKQAQSRIEIKGSAESNTRVSAFMRNIDKSGWLKEPDLEVVEVKATGKGGKADANAPRASEFTVFARQVSSLGEEDGE